MTRSFGAEPKSLDADTVRQTARGRWAEIVCAVGGIAAELLDGKHHPCPRCPGGTDRFRVFGDFSETGGMICNKCHATKNSDGFAAVQWLTGCTFPEAVAKVAGYLGISAGTGATGALKAGNADDFLRDVCVAKRMPQASAVAYGATVTSWGSHRVVEFAVYDETGRQCSKFAISADGSKGRFAKGKPAGLFFAHRDGKPVLPQPGETWLAVEGVKDAAALHSLGYQVVGWPTSAMNEKFAPLFRGVQMILVPDRDAAGQKGARQTCERLAGIAASVKIATLPGEARESNGIDCRDILATENGVSLVRQAITGGTEALPDESITPVPVIPSSEFFYATYTRDYIVEGVLTAGEPCVIGGRSKTLKTTIAIDLALSVGTGTPFLGMFPTRRSRVAMLSGESGDCTLQETARRIAVARVIDPALSDVFWGFELPCLGSPEGIESLGLMIEQNEIRLLIVDPVYLSLMGDATKGLNAGNLFDIGPLLMKLAAACKARSTTLVLLHHCRKNSSNEKFAPPELEELAMAGFGEFARQWILLGRRESYQCDGEHRLWLAIGGSAGHGGLWALDVSEGDPDDRSGRRWNVTLRTAHDASEERKRAAERRKAAEKQEREQQQRERLIKVIEEFPQGETATVLRGKLSLSGERFKLVAEGLESDGIVRRCKVTKAGRTLDAWQLTENEGASDNDATAVGPVGPVGQKGESSDCPGTAGNGRIGRTDTGTLIECACPSGPSDVPASGGRQSDSKQNLSGSRAVALPGCEHEPKDYPDPNRSGWIKTHCRLCGRWLGNRPASSGGDVLASPDGVRSSPIGSSTRIVANGSADVEAEQQRVIELGELPKPI